MAADAITQAQIEIANTGGVTGTWNYAGQSVTLPAGVYDQLRFSWFRGSGPSASPTAFGRLYVFDKEYPGRPIDLDPSMPGFVARSAPEPTDPVGGVGQGIEYAFDSGVTLTGGRAYWFYTDAQGHFTHSFDEDLYAGGDMYLAGMDTLPFRKAHAAGRMVNGVLVPPPDIYVDANFRLRVSQQ